MTDKVVDIEQEVTQNPQLSPITIQMLPVAKVPISIEMGKQKIKHEDEEEELEKKNVKPNEIEELTKDFWFSRQLVDKPGTIMIIIFVILVILNSIIFLGGYFEMSEESDREFFVLSDEKIIRQDAVVLAQKDYNKVLEAQRDLSERSVEYEDGTIYAIYESKNGETLLTPENVTQMLKFEQGIREINDNQYDKEFCLTKGKNDITCKKPFSVPLSIVETYGSQVTQQQIDTFLSKITDEEGFYEENKFMFDKDFTKSNIKVLVARSFYKVGFPFKGYKDSLDEDNKQRDYLAKWNEKLYDYIEDFNAQGNLDIIPFSLRMMEEYSDNQLDKDIMFSFVALGFVTFYMMFHTRSVSIGLVGMFIMGITFPTSYFFYRLVIFFRFFMALHTSILFILMGVGADDLFVFFDAFQQAGNMKECQNDLLKRISYAYRRASKAMLITSSTTIIAFLATAISKLLPIMTFGIFSAINILVNYILVITFLPAFLVWREKRILKKVCRSVCGEKKKEEQVDVESQIKNPQNTEEKMTKVQLFFKEKWAVWTYKFRYPIIFFFVVLFALKILGTLQLDSPTEPPTMLMPDHFMRKGLNAIREDFPFGAQDTNSIGIDLVWGLEGTDQSNTDFFEPNDAGELIYNDPEDFDITPEANQQRLLDICDELKEQKYVKLVYQQEGNMVCPMKTFKAYVESETTYNFPVPQAKFNELFGQFVKSEAAYDLNQEKQVGFIDGKVSYFMISFSGNELGQQSKDILEALFDEYEDLMYEINQKSPKGVQYAFQKSEDWQWMVSEKALIEGAMTGFIICLSLSFVMLLISTSNIILAFYAIICIVAILLGVLSVIWMRGWEFGAFQSMNSIIIIGLSVDYCVHLVNAYTESEKEGRQEKTEEMLSVMGVSVLGGGMTTLGAGLFLFLGKLLFLNIMGILMCATIGFSILWSLLFLPALLHVAGPQGKTGNVVHYFKLLFNYEKSLTEDQQQQKQ